MNRTRRAESPAGAERSVGDGSAGDSSPAATKVASGRRTHRERLEWTLTALADLRGLVYRLFAALLLYPGEQRIEWLRATAGELRLYDDELAAFAFFVPWQRWLTLLVELDGQDTATLEVEYVRLFNINPAGTPCYPYESWHLAPGSPEMGLVVAQLQHTYARAGLRLSPSLNESPDHAAVELEFMAYLCQQEATGWADTRPEDATGILAQERVFLRLHLARWFSIFSRQIVAATTERFYATGVTAADAFIHHDLDLADALSSNVKQLRKRAPAARRPGEELHREGER